MDLNTVTSIVRPRRRDDLRGIAPGQAWLAGGTWLFSEPQPDLNGLVDLADLGWTPLEVTAAGLSIAATCTVAQLDAFEPPPSWVAGPLIGLCCRAFLASFKIWTMATVGGNICMALPAGPMTSLCAALDGTCVIWTPDGGERQVPVVDFVIGPQQTSLAPGELLRQIDLPREAFSRRTAFRRASLSTLGRSAALLIGSLSGTGTFVLTITAATRHPVQLTFAAVPTAAELLGRLDAALPPPSYYDDVHGRPDWRQHMTTLFAEEIRAELADRRP